MQGLSEMNGTGCMWHKYTWSASAAGRHVRVIYYVIWCVVWVSIENYLFPLNYPFFNIPEGFQIFFPFQSWLEGLHLFTLVVFPHQRLYANGFLLFIYSDSDSDLDSDSDHCVPHFQIRLLLN